MRQQPNPPSLVADSHASPPQLSLLGCDPSDFACQCSNFSNLENDGESCVLANCGVLALDVLAGAGALCACVTASPTCSTSTVPSTTTTTTSGTTSSTSSTFTTSITSRPTPIVCNQSNCLRELEDSRFSNLASPFCFTYTTTLNTAPSAIPTYLENCAGDPVAVSSACSCLIPAGVTPTQTPTPTPLVCNKDNCLRELQDALVLGHGVYVLRYLYHDGECSAECHSDVFGELCRRA